MLVAPAVGVVEVKRIKAEGPWALQYSAPQKCKLAASIQKIEPIAGVLGETKRSLAMRQVSGAAEQTRERRMSS